MLPSCLWSSSAFCRSALKWTVRLSSTSSADLRFHPTIHLVSLPTSSTPEEIKEELGKYGNIAQVILSHSRRHAQVTFEGSEDHKNILRACVHSRVPYKDRRVKVFLKGPHTHNEPSKSECVVITGLPDSATDTDVKQLFPELETEVKKVLLREYPQELGGGKRAVVTFSEEIHAKKALGQRPYAFNNHALKVGYEYPPSSVLYWCHFFGRVQEIRQTIDPQGTFIKHFHPNLKPQTGFIHFHSVDDATRCLEEFEGTRTPSGGFLHFRYRDKRKLTSPAS